MNEQSARFPALYGEPVTEKHTRECAERGHASHTIDGEPSGHCPRCGERVAPDPVSSTPIRKKREGEADSKSARDWTCESVWLIVDNERRWQERAYELARDVVMRSGDDYTEHEVHDELGVELRDFIAEQITKTLPRDTNPVRLLLVQLLDYADREQWARIANPYASAAYVERDDARDGLNSDDDEPRVSVDDVLDTLDTNPWDARELSAAADAVERQLDKLDRTCPSCGHKTMIHNKLNGQTFCTRAVSALCDNFGQQRSSDS